MAQTNYTPISLYYSATASNVPTAANLVPGELAINTNDGKLYYEDSSGVVQVLASKAGALGDVVGPASATDNALARFDLTTGKLIQNSIGILTDAGALSGLTGLTSSGPITLSSLTSGRVTYAGTAGLLQDSAGLTYDGTNLTTTGTATATRFIPSGSTVATNGIYLPAANTLGFSTNSTERMRIDSSGRLSVAGANSNDTTYSSTKLWLYGGSGNALICGGISGQGIGFFVNTISVDANGYNSGASTAIGGGYVTTTGRSANFGGTVNASGSDYAEYMTKAGDFAVAKGDIVGINAQGKLTNVFANAVSFVVKSTNPSYVGGDTWGSEESIGMKKPLAVSEDATDEEKSKYLADLTSFETLAEAARQLVDRIAFSGQVPVNVTGATAGQYIIPVNNSGAIKGEAVSNPTFEQYQTAVGKVIAIEADGRARIIVKVA